MLLYDFSRSFCFTVDAPLTFALFKAQKFFDYANKTEPMWNWCLFSYMIYICFLGNFYIIFVLCDMWTEIKKFRKKA